MKIIEESFGQINGETVSKVTLKNDSGIEITCINYGCIITKIVTPDKDGKFENIVLGYDSIEEYVNNESYFGAVCGRVAGRIQGGTFKLDGNDYSLSLNDNLNHLHGGIQGFSKVIWNRTTIESEHEVGVQFSCLSPDGEEGYPGNLKVKVIYMLNQNNELTISYLAQTDQKTLVNLTNHSYFNLSGNLNREIVDHTLTLKSYKFLELNSELLPTGNFLNVKGTPFDFTVERAIHTGITSTHPQNLLAGKGYDHPFLLDTNHDHEIVLKDPESGRTLTIETDQVCVVVYSGNSLPSTGKIRGIPSRKYLGICLETQGLPDAIHYPQFPSVTLEKGGEYSAITKYRFGN